MATPVTYPTNSVIDYNDIRFNDNIRLLVPNRQQPLKSISGNCYNNH